MYVVSVTIWVKPEHAEAFLVETLKNARGSRTEPGNLRYDVSRTEGQPATFFLYEVYKDKDALAAHQQTPHYLAWRDAVQGWMEKPRQGVRHESIFPEGNSGW